MDEDRHIVWMILDFILILTCVIGAVVCLLRREPQYAIAFALLALVFK